METICQNKLCMFHAEQPFLDIRVIQNLNILVGIGQAQPFPHLLHIVRLIINQFIQNDDNRQTGFLCCFPECFPKFRRWV